MGKKLVGKHYRNLEGAYANQSKPDSHKADIPEESYRAGFPRMPRAMPDPRDRILNSGAAMYRYPQQMGGRKWWKPQHGSWWRPATSFYYPLSAGYGCPGPFYGCPRGYL